MNDTQAVPLYNMKPSAVEHMLVRYISYLNAQMSQANTSPQRQTELTATIQAVKADLEALRIQLAGETTTPATAQALQEAINAAAIRRQNMEAGKQRLNVERGPKAVPAAAPEPTAKVIPLGCLTKLDVPADRVLDGAKGKLEGVLVLGFEEDGGEFYAASSYADGGTVLWLMEQCKLLLLKA